MSSPSSPFFQNSHRRRSSLTSRLSFAFSATTDQGETGGARAPVQAQIEDEIAEIKRYEVRGPWFAAVTM